MSFMEYMFGAISLACLITSSIVWCLTYEWKIRIEKKCAEVEETRNDLKQIVGDLDSALFHHKEDLLELKKTFYNCGLETLKVRSEDHDASIEAIRRDLLDLQVISGTLPSKAGTMLEEVSNTLEELKAVKSHYMETRALLDATKEQVEGLAKAYATIHFTSKTIEDIRNDIDDMKDDLAKLKEAA